jgi:signal transduction histidine kinase
MALEVEGLYDVRIEPVVVGDRPMNDDFAALIAAAREACVNAAKHSGVQEVSVFVEVGVARVDAFVRDRGVGFDRAAVSSAGRGIERSMEARLERVGGSVAIESAPGRGTEVHLSVPLSETAEAMR